jgi:hypothetical protein
LSGLRDVEPDLVQLAVSQLRRLNAAEDPLATQEWIVKDDFDRAHTLGGSPGDHTAATDKLGQLRAQAGIQAMPEPCSERALAPYEAQPRIRRDSELDANAHNLAITVRTRPAVAPLSQPVARLGSGSDSQTSWAWGHRSNPTPSVPLQQPQGK